MKQKRRKFRLSFSWKVNSEFTMLMKTIPSQWQLCHSPNKDPKDPGTQYNCLNNSGFAWIYKNNLLLLRKCQLNYCAMETFWVCQLLSHADRKCCREKWKGEAVSDADCWSLLKHRQNLYLGANSTAETDIWDPHEECENRIILLLLEQIPDSRLPHYAI